MVRILDQGEVELGVGRDADADADGSAVHEQAIGAATLRHGGDRQVGGVGAIVEAEDRSRAVRSEALGHLDGADAPGLRGLVAVDAATAVRSEALEERVVGVDVVRRADGLMRARPVGVDLRDLGAGDGLTAGLGDFRWLFAGRADEGSRHGQG